MSNKTGKKCGKCGADMVINPHTGKEFCENKCWLKSSVTPVQAQAMAKVATATEDKKWDKISWGKCKHNFLIELFKAGHTLEEAEKIAENWADASMR